MTSKRRWTWLLSVLALAAGFSLMVAAYGVAANRTKAAPKQSHASVGTLKAVLDTIDFLDPQQAYTGQSWWAMWNVWETLLTEVVFGLPGVGRLTYNSLVALDLPVIMATVIYGAFFITIMSALVDIVYAQLDPRIRPT